MEKLDVYDDNISCVAATYQECKTCGEITRLDTEAGLERVEIKNGLPHIKCDCGSLTVMSMVHN